MQDLNLNYYQKRKFRHGNFSSLIEENNNSENWLWLLILGDLLSLLLSFFILIYIDKMPTEELWRNIVTSVNIKYSMRDYNEINAIFTKKTTKDIPIKTGNIRSVFLEQIFHKNFEDKPILNDIHINNENNKTIISIPKDFIFADSNKLSEDGIEILTLIGNSLSKYKNDLTIVFNNYIYNSEPQLNTTNLLKESIIVANFLRSYSNGYKIITGVTNKHLNDITLIPSRIEIIIND